MQRWPDAIYDYIVEHSRFDNPLLRQMEARARKDGFPIIGPLVGPWLYLFARLTGAKRVFELGSGFGYSTWYFASALRDNGGGEVVHTVWDRELSEEAQGWLERAGLLGSCDFQVSESVLALESDKGGNDIIFMDIDKEGYPDAMPVIERQLRPGGLLLVDNVLWDGRILDNGDTSPATESIRRFNTYLARSSRWQYVVNPLRDGLGVARLIGGPT